MNKVTTFLRRFTVPHNPPVESYETTLPFPVYEIAHQSAPSNSAALDVLQWAPIWMGHGERLLLYTLIYNLRPARYLEIGTLKGGSALIVTTAMDALQAPGRIVCVDPQPQIALEHWNRLKHRTTLITGFSPDVLPHAQKAAGGPFDFVLIDGDHSHAGALRDAQGILPFVADGAYVIFHDSFFVEVMQAIDDFVAQHSDQVADFGSLTREVSIVTEPNAGPVRWGGLRLLQVRRRVRPR